MKNGSLTVVGSGIKFMSHLTVEARTYIEQSEKLLYLVNEPIMKQWLEQVNPSAESLDPIYFQYKLRIKNYLAITNYILEILKQSLHVCVVLYGHPAVFAMPALNAVRLAKQDGFDARVLPAISAEDCLFADLLVDPGQYGCQSFEATDLLIHNRMCDPTSHLIIWQVGVIGALGPSNMPHDNQIGLELLKAHLSKWYHQDTEIVLYEAALYPTFDPRIIRFKLSELTEAPLSRISTLYIAPITKNEINYSMLELLKINIHDLSKNK